MQPRIYTYKITFEEVPYYYYGVHKEKYFNEYYMGSPYTHKWCWNFYTPKKQILEVFPYTDDGWLEANLVEDRLIKPFYNTDKWCLNESCGGRISLQILRETGKRMGKINGRRIADLKIGIHAHTKEQKAENARKIPKESCIKGGKRAAELKVGVHSLTKEQLSENGKRGGSIGGKISGPKVGPIVGQIFKEKKIGICGLTKEQRIENGKKYGSKAGKLGSAKTNSQKWMCLETGYITNAGALTMYQNARGIDKSKRIRIE
jgi:hypothetical protein